MLGSVGPTEIHGFASVKPFYHTSRESGLGVGLGRFVWVGMGVLTWGSLEFTLII